MNRFLYVFFFLCSPSQDDFRMTGAGNKLGANAKDGFLCSSLKSHDGAQEIKTDLLRIKNSKNKTLSNIYFFYSFVVTKSSFFLTPTIMQSTHHGDGVHQASQRRGVTKGS